VGDREVEMTCYYCNQELTERTTGQGRVLCDPSGNPHCYELPGISSAPHSTHRNEEAEAIGSALAAWSAS